MRKIVLPLAVLVGYVSGNYYQSGKIPRPSYSAFNSVDPSFDSSLSCYTCIQNDYLYCRQGTQEQLMLTTTSDPPPEVCCKSYLECPALYKKDWMCSTTYEDKMLAMRMCPVKQSKCGEKNALVFNKAGEAASMNMTLNPGDVCVYNLRAKCGIPTLEFETD